MPAEQDNSTQNADDSKSQQTIPGTQSSETPKPAPTGAEVNMTSDQLKARLDETRTAGAKAAKVELLKELGFDSATAAKAAFATLKQLQDAQLTEQERAANRIKELEPYEAEVTTLRTQLEEDVDERIAALPENARAAIEANAKTVQEKRAALRLLAMANVTSAAPADSATDGNGQQQSAAGQGVVPKLISTTSAPNPPKPSGEPTAWEKYQDLLKTDAVGASLFFQLNRLQIAETEPAES